MPLSFSISVPIGAYHPLLADCLESLAIQTPRPAVSLLDASGDPRVAEVADRFSDLIVYRRHGPDKGQSDAILEGWRETPGEVLGWLNADDALYPGALAAAMARLEEADRPDVVCGHTVIINDDFDVTGYHWAVEPPSESLLWGDTISQPSCFFRRAAYERAGGLDASLHYTMDWDLWVRLWRSGARFAFIDQTLSRVLWTREAKTGGFGPARRRELDRIINQNASPSRRLKSKLGFALHHVFEYMLPGPLARVLRRRVSKTGAVIHGLGRSGEVESAAFLPLVRYGAPLRAVDLRFANGAATVSSQSHGGAGDVADGKVTLALDKPAASGETVDLRIENRGGAPAILTHITLR
ncbi:glycosyltransferase [Hyphococcus sp.]|jgi:GT2 family glycosyltransferase|uniref:glycosyltransferase n=1 Tax=Hyphococcus sp. TaxID=2038636 RepID=UPI003D0FA822